MDTPVGGYGEELPAPTAVKSWVFIQGLGKVV
jgi:hypothetical protein